VDDVFRIKETPNFLFKTLENFFDFVSAQQVIDYHVSLDIMLRYAGLDNTYGIKLLKTQLTELESEAGRSFANTQLIPLLHVANTRNYEAVRLMVRILNRNASAEDMAALLEDLEADLALKH